MYIYYAAFLYQNKIEATFNIHIKTIFSFGDISFFSFILQKN